MTANGSPETSPDDQPVPARTIQFAGVHLIALAAVFVAQSRHYSNIQLLALTSSPLAPNNKARIIAKQIGYVTCVDQGMRGLVRGGDGDCDVTLGIDLRSSLTKALLYSFSSCLYFLFA